MFFCSKETALMLCTMLVIATLCSAQSQDYVAKFNASGGTTNSSIFDNGNVGIGTTNPGFKLDIATGPIHLSGNTDIAWSDASFYAQDTGTNARTFALGARSGGFSLSDETAGLVRIYITGNGNMGIGTFGPNDKLHVLAPGGANAGITIGDPSDSSAGTNRINFLAWRDMYSGNPNFTGASIYTARQYVCCGGYPNGGYAGVIMTDPVFSTRDPSNWSADGFLDLSERMRIAAGGNVGIGTTAPSAKLEVNGNLKISAGSGASIVFPDSTIQTTAWTGALCGGDYAESVDVSGERAHYEPGDVMVIDSTHPGNFLKSSTPYSRTVAGIYSTKPGAIGRRSTDPQKVKSEIPMAMVGIVPTKVTTENGPIGVGDLLVTSSTAGYAMKGTDGSRLVGAVVGKALGSLSNGTGLIEVLVTLQ